MVTSNTPRGRGANNRNRAHDAALVAQPAQSPNGEASTNSTPPPVAEPAVTEVRRIFAERDLPLATRAELLGYAVRCFQDSNAELDADALLEFIDDALAVMGAAAGAATMDGDHAIITDCGVRMFERLRRMVHVVRELRRRSGEVCDG